MSGILDYRISSAVPDATNYTVTLKWSDGSVTVAEFRHLTEDKTEGSVFTTLKDRKFFAQVSVKRNGRVLAWPGIDFCAHALWFEAHPEDMDRELPSFRPLQ